MILSTGFTSYHTDVSAPCYTDQLTLYILSTITYLGHRHCQRNRPEEVTADKHGNAEAKESHSVVHSLNLSLEYTLLLSVPRSLHINASLHGIFWSEYDQQWHVLVCLLGNHVRIFNVSPLSNQHVLRNLPSTCLVFKIDYVVFLRKERN